MTALHLQAAIASLLKIKRHLLKTVYTLQVLLLLALQISTLQVQSMKSMEQWLQLKPDLLKQIALTTGGAYIPAGTRAYDLGEIYEEHLAGLARGEDAVSEKRKRYREQFQLFLCLGIGMLLASALVPEYPAERKLMSVALQEVGR